MDRKGFISISVVYTLFIVLLMLLLSILAGYVNKRLLLKVNKGDISDILVDSEDNRNIATVCRGQYLGNCFSQNSNLDKDLYHHDGNVDYLGQVNAELEAKDNSYRYAGANPHNFVCIDNQEKGTCDDSNLYRIIGLFAIDADTYAAKLIKYTSLGKNAWNSDATINLNGWWESSLRTSLNDINSSPIKGIFSYIHEDDWYVDRQSNDNMVHQIPQNVYNFEKYVTEITGNSKMIVNSKIGLMYISDYMYAASPEAWTYVGDNYGISGTDYSSAKAINWLAGTEEFVLTSVSGVSNNQVFYLQASGKVGVCTVTDAKDIRPVFSILPNAIVKSGIGIKTEPYRLSIMVS